MKPSTLAITKAGTNEERIIEAAVTCIRQFGAKRCTMEDFARVAGLGRKTVYRCFPNRDALLDAVALRQFQELGKTLEKQLNIDMPFSLLAETIILRATHWLSNDPIIESLLEGSDYLSFGHYLMAPESPFEGLTEQLFLPYFERAREREEIRDNLDITALVHWLRSGQLLIMLKGDISIEEQRQFIHDFILPAVLNLKPHKRSAKTPSRFNQ